MNTRFAGTRLQKPRLFCTALAGAAVWAGFAPTTAEAQAPPAPPSTMSPTPAPAPTPPPAPARKTPDAELTLSPWQAEPELPPEALPPVLRGPRPEVLIQPSIGIEGTFTDNAELLPTDKRSDFIARVALGVDVDVDRGRTTGWLRAFGYYDHYFKLDDLSGWTVSTDGFVNYDIVHDILAVQAGGSYSDQYISVLGIPDTERSGTPGRARVGLVYAGPVLTTRVGGFADLYAAVRGGQVWYSEVDNSGVTALPSDDAFVQLGARLDTGARARSYQLISTGKFVADDRDYRSTSLVQSAYLRVAPTVRLIARGGYERVRQKGVISIDSPMFSAGVEYSPTDNFRLSLEGGNRYDRPAWAGSADWRVSQTFSLTARYWEVLSPDQLQLVDAFSEFVSTDQLLPAPTSTTGFRVGQNLANQVSFNKQADFGVTYARESYRLDLSTGWSDRRFVQTGGRDKSVTTRLTATRHSRPDLDLIADLYYADTYESDEFNEGTSWGAEATIAYRLNSTTDARARYRHQRGHEFFVGGDQYTENAVILSLEKRF
jgi:uncharacterized protein (PEP-CTERM system associated)